MHRCVYGNDHQMTLATICNLAATHRDMCDNAAALPLMQEALDGTRHTLGSDHIRTSVEQRWSQRGTSGGPSTAQAARCSRIMAP